MAAVGAVYTIEPFVRTADEVIDEVMREKAAKRRRSPSHKRVRAELLVGKVALFLWLADEVMRRNPTATKPLIFLSDGERALHDRQGEYLPEERDLYPGPVPRDGAVVEGGVVLLRRGDPEAGGPPVGGEGVAYAPGREGGFRGGRLASDEDQAKFEGGRVGRPSAKWRAISSGIARG